MYEMCHLRVNFDCLIPEKFKPKCLGQTSIIQNSHLYSVASLLYDIEANLKYHNFPKTPLELWRRQRCASHPVRESPFLAIFSGGDNAECLSINLSPTQPQLPPNLIIFNTWPAGIFGAIFSFYSSI